MSLTSAKPRWPKQARGDRRPVAPGAVHDGRLGDVELVEPDGSWPTGMTVAPGIVPAAVSPRLRMSTIWRSVIWRRPLVERLGRQPRCHLDVVLVLEHHLVRVVEVADHPVETDSGEPVLALSSWPGSVNSTISTSDG